MRFPLLKIALATSLAAMASPLAAQNITIAPGDRILENAFNAEEIQFYHDSVILPNPQQQQAGMNIQTISGFNSGFVYDFCADFYMGTDVASTSYNYTSGLSAGISDPIRRSQIEVLISNTLPEFNSLLQDYIADTGSWNQPMTPEDIAAYQTAYDNLLAYAGGIQIALWEIIHEDSANRSVNSDGSIAGDFYVGMGDAGTAPGNLAGTRAEEFLTNIRSTTNPWTNQGGWYIYFADAVEADQQDRIWITSVPEPSATLLGALGFLMILRRRR